METTISEEKLASAKTLTTVIYALYAASLLVGVTSIIAIVMNYVKKDDVAGTWIESHFRWQIRTFWFGLLWLIIRFALADYRDHHLCSADRLAGAGRCLYLVYLSGSQRMA